jgi:hypothetical protein
MDMGVALVQADLRVHGYFRASLHHADFKDPAFSFLMLLEKGGGIPAEVQGAD